MAVETSRVLARAYLTNPLHVTAFGPGDFARNEAFFRAALTVMKGQKFVAVEATRVRGFVHWAPFPHCQFSKVEKLRMAPAMVRDFGIRSALRVSRWLSAWSEHDPQEAHSHLGPIGVEPEAQGRRIGQRMMELHCDELDRTGQTSYLETDRLENVSFYGRYGFKIIGEIRVLGTQNYLMWRESGTSDLGRGEGRRQTGSGH